MTSPRVDLLVLDAHGVVLNAYWPHFLGEIARCIGEPEHELTRRWHDTLREDAWCGRIDDEELWNRLTRARMNDAECRALLEAGYTLGPLAVHLNAWATRVPVWLLSNHRSHWLRPRLQRFGIYHLFQRVLVSDGIGACKPEPEAFAEVLRSVSRSEHALFVDDQRVHVQAAERLGMATLQGFSAGEWVQEINRRINVANRSHDDGPDQHAVASNAMPTCH